MKFKIGLLALILVLASTAGMSESGVQHSINSPQVEMMENGGLALASNVSPTIVEIASAFVQDDPSGGIVDIPEYQTIDEVAEAVRDHFNGLPDGNNGWQYWINWFAVLGVIILGIAAFVQKNIISALKKKAG